MGEEPDTDRQDTLGARTSAIDAGSATPKALCFVSYSRSDAGFVLWLKKALAEHEIDSWRDEDDIPAGASWDAEIEQAISRCSHFLLVVSAMSMGSANVADEFSFAREKRKPMIPLLLEDVALPLRVHRAQAIDFKGNRTVALSKLLIALGRPQSEVLAARRRKGRRLAGASVAISALLILGAYLVWSWTPRPHNASVAPGKQGTTADTLPRLSPDGGDTAHTDKTERTDTAHPEQLVMPPLTAQLHGEPGRRPLDESKAVTGNDPTVTTIAGHSVPDGQAATRRELEELRRLGSTPRTGLQASERRVVACLGPSASLTRGREAEMATTFRSHLTTELRRLGATVYGRESLMQLLEVQEMASASTVSRTGLGKALPGGIAFFGDMISNGAEHRVVARLVDLDSTQILGGFSAVFQSDADMIYASRMLAGEIAAKVPSICGGVTTTIRSTVTISGGRLTISLGGRDGVTTNTPFMLVKRREPGGTTNTENDAFVGEAVVTELKDDSAELSVSASIVDSRYSFAELDLFETASRAANGQLLATAVVRTDAGPRPAEQPGQQ